MHLQTDMFKQCTCVKRIHYDAFMSSLYIIASLPMRSNKIALPDINKMLGKTSKQLINFI